MEVLYVLIPLALGFVLAMVAVFAWAVRGGQFDDLETPALRVLFDDAQPAVAPVASVAEHSRSLPSRRVASVEVPRVHPRSTKR